MNSNSKNQRKILTALANGSTVTKLTAMHENVGNVMDVIMRLRRAGWDIETVMKTDLSDRRYASYVLAPRQRAAARARVQVAVAS
jgi:hypothetical protein